MRTVPPELLRIERALTAIKVVHTVVWVFFVACIAVIPVFAWRASYRYAALFIGIVALEVAALALNGRRCPLTDMATRYTDDRRDNFDIYLPEWLARHNKLIFRALYVAGIVLTLLRWNGGR
ncbi:MAG: hypothetical protein ABIQ49_11765 [Gemmatimonadales bacterium]